MAEVVIGRAVGAVSTVLMVVVMMPDVTGLASGIGGVVWIA